MTATGADEADGLRAVLIQAARAELAAGGRSDVSLRAVARRAGVSHAAPGYVFRDRAGLLAAVAADGFRELARVVDAPVDADEPHLATLGRRYVRFAADNPALYELMFQRPGVPVDDELRDARSASLRALSAATGGLDGRPTGLTIVSWALAHGLASLSAHGALAELPGSDEPAPDAAVLVGVFAAMVESSTDAGS